MVGKNNKSSDLTVVDIQFEECLTSSSCSKVVVEIIKYLAYQKQQIPYPFEQLKLLVNKKKIDDGGSRENAIKRRCVQLERHYSKASEAVDTLESTFKNIEAEFLTSEEEGIGKVEEVVVLFGATPITPKDVFRIQLPSVSNHSIFDTPKPPSRKIMVHLLRCLLQSEGLNSIISHPITTTNAFVFFKRKAASDKMPKVTGGGKRWFLPRENFRLPQKGRQAVLRIECSPQVPEVNFDSPLARPLVDVSDMEEDVCDSQPELQVKQKSPKMGNGDGSKIQRNLDSHPILNVFSTHLVFKPAPLEKEVCRENLATADEERNISNQVERLVNEVLGSIDSPSETIQESQLDSCRTENGFVEVNSIEWFEARVHLKGFKDYVVNGVSAINA